MRVDLSRFVFFPSGKFRSNRLFGLCFNPDKLAWSIFIQRPANRSLLNFTPPAAFVEGIRAGGLQKRSRNHVHLAADEATAIKVGARRAEPIILHVDAAAMRQDEPKFYLSANGVWFGRFSADQLPDFSQVSRP
ncbi:RNA 2'-phosphotransferase [Roseimaritima multifibrata]|uniref:RNA 2'-phosphotransferase n=1 Tax=Roseimaritima multifibrata TaxID=1930274 RepID=A0A517MIU7_9BACT|nr:RNA 2'-phosphotransferase [Roseimaritima multifibrata]QDS94717.1 RNA 2'-phosphotransferase [Roseimaritima multifibrata]